MSETRTDGVHALFDRDEVREVLDETFYRPAPPKPSRKRRKKAKPTHYEVICISLYTEDLARLDEKVQQLKDSGHRKMSRSALIRYALDTVDLDGLPRPY